MSDPSTTTDGAGTLERRVRLRNLFWEYRRLFAIGCLLLVGLGAWVGYGVYVAPAETTEQRPVSEWTATGAFTHEATVTESNAIYDQGTVVAEAPIYFTAISPTVDGTYVAGYDAETGEDVEINLTATVQYGAIDPDEQTVYWSERQVLAEERASGVTPDDEVTMTFDLNVTAIEDRIEEIERDLQATPGQTDVYVELEREITGTIDGEPEAVTDLAIVTIDRQGNTYRIEDDGEFDESHGHQEVVTVPVSDGPTRSVGGPLAVVLGIVGLAGVALASRRTSPPTPAEREWLAYREQLDAVDELIVEARLPRAGPECSRATVSNLESLANVGLDVGSVLVYDPTAERYVVEDGDRRYVYEPPTLEGVDDASNRGAGVLGWLRPESAPADGESAGVDSDRDDAADEPEGRAVTHEEPTASADAPKTDEDATRESGPRRSSSDRPSGDAERRLDPELACLAGVGSGPTDETDQNRSSEN